jgi:hypothetical protein
MAYEIAFPYKHTARATLLPAALNIKVMAGPEVEVRPIGASTASISPAVVLVGKEAETALALEDDTLFAADCTQRSSQCESII